VPFNEALRAALRPLWVSEMARSGMPDATFLESIQKVTPMNFGFGKSTADAQDHAFAVIAPDSAGNEFGAVADHPADADLVVGGIEEELGDWRQRTVAPLFKFGLQLLVEVEYLAGGELQATEIFHDFGDAAGAYPLDIHGGDGRFECAITAQTFLQQ